MINLVAGGAGFLGSHLCKNLIKKNQKVICIDSLVTGNLNNVNDLIKNQDFQFINHDVKNPIDLKVDKIYNLACPASPKHYQSDPIDTVKTSVYGAFNLLDLSIKNNCRILQASTSEIYGDPLMHPQKEDYFGNVNPIGSRSCYDEGKRCAETIFFDYKRELGAKIKVVRIFNTYGPLMAIDDGRVVSNFINQCLDNENITIYGDGSQTRSLCYVDDLIEALIKTMEIKDEISGPINLGNPEEISIKDLAMKIMSLTKSNNSISYNKLPEDDPIKRKPDIDYAKLILDNWQPKVSIDDGLNKTIAYFKNTKKI
tara:strand:- start:14211 stop:15149 length:939 start_codon:yes stop_codon:yes gene_type:complete